MGQITIQLFGDEADVHELDAVARRLSSELEALEGCEVSPATSPAPAGAKAVEIGLLGQLLLTIIGPSGVAVALVAVLRDWLARHKDFKLKIKRGDTEIELSGGDPEKLQGLLAEVKSLLADLPRG
jgi:hypothetical protein